MGGPGYLEQALKTIRLYIIGWFIFSGLLLVGLWYLTDVYLDLNSLITLAVLIVSWLAISIAIGLVVAWQVNKPLSALAQAIMHVSPSPLPINPPDLEKLNIAKELVANLTRQVYEYAAHAGGEEVQPNTPSSSDTVQKLPVAVIGINKEGDIIFANPKAQDYAKSTESLAGKNLYNQFDILFQDENTLENWIEACREKSVIAQKIWHGVKMSPFGGEDNQSQYCDLAASYVQQGAGSTTEVIITMLDQTETYAEDDKSLGFVALAVHELRTPLTILRGYIEVFEDELSKDLDPEMQGFMQKMQVAAENLTAFVGNILNVARLEQDQLSLKLHEEDWKETLSGIVDNMQLRAKVHGKNLLLTVGDDLPKVGIDKVSIAEVMINLIDNAIKYSPADKTLIRINAVATKDNLVETTVQDSGVGIPEAIVPHLFEKYSRNHRNRSTVSGTGLGLYLSKALVSAHGGNIWVRSKEGEGSTFGFTLLPYDQLADKDKNGDNKEITRSAHGWIKNHSLSRQ